MVKGQEEKILSFTEPEQLKAEQRLLRKIEWSAGFRDLQPEYLFITVTHRFQEWLDIDERQARQCKVTSNQD